MEKKKEAYSGKRPVTRQTYSFLMAPSSPNCPASFFAASLFMATIMMPDVKRSNRF